MAIASKMASPAAILPANVVNLSGRRDFRFHTSTPRPMLPPKFFISKFCTLSISSRQVYTMPLCGLPGTSWNFPINPEDKNVQLVAKSNCLRMSMKERNPKRLSSASKKNELDYFQMPLRGLHGASWRFPISTGVDSADKAEFQKHALRAAVPVFYAKADKNVQQVAKSNRPRMSMKERNPKRLSSSASKKIELDYFQVLKYPLVTELAMQEMLHKNTLVFVVDKRADKKNIKAAIEKISSVQTKKVNTLVMPDGNKKAYIMLRPSHNALEVAKETWNYL